MASFKVRRKLIAQGGIKVGAGGDDIAEILFGTTTACTPAINASGATSSGSIAITGLNAGAKVVLMPINGNNGLYVASASCTAAGGVTACFASATGEALNASTTMKFAYIAFV